MKFRDEPGEKIVGRLEYIAEDKSLNFVPDDEALRPSKSLPSVSLIVAQTLQLEVSMENGRILYAWGYLPQESWTVESMPLDTITSHPGIVYVEWGDINPEAGVGYRTSLDSASARFFEGSGDLVIGNITDSENFIEVAQGIVLGISNGDIRSLILKPEI